MKNRTKMPTAVICDLLSWGIVLGGGGAVVLGFMAGPRDPKAIVLLALLLLGSWATAVLVRMAGIIGQALFDMNARMALFEEQSACDSKDINENIRQIRDFFESIAKHLNLQK